MPGQTHHAIDYIEINVDDMDKAKAFYTSAFDWEFNDYGPGYQGIKSKSCNIDEISPGHLCTLMVSDHSCILFENFSGL